MDDEDLEWDSEDCYDEWDSRWKENRSSSEREDSSYNSRDWTESWDKESDWDESDDSSQIEIIDLIQSRDYDSVEILRAVIPIKGTYNNRLVINGDPSLDNNRSFINNRQPSLDNNRAFINNKEPSLDHNQPPNLHSSLFYGEDITFLNVCLKDNKYKPSFYKDLIHKEYTNCSICLCTFTNYSKVLSLLCTHYFHSKCIIPWIKKHKQCPCCREGT